MHQAPNSGIRSYTTLMENRGQTVLDMLEPPAGLCGAVLSRIALARRRRARVRLAVDMCVFFISGALLVPLAQYAGSEIYTSGFYEFFSLLFSDRQLILSSWQEFAFILLEKLPSIAVLLILSATIVLVWSLRRAVLSSKVAFTSLHTA
ncbi:MAG: hypothetical protein QG621_227 [Patescibacteria group bacterium]|nr:hypothetical protein [Patescibacteria group bacterium]